MPRTQEQNKQIRAAKMAVIMEAAMKLFSHKGYDGTSTAMIAKEAGISKGLLYHYIKSKEDLIRLIIQKSNHLVVDIIDAIEMKGDTLSGSEFEVLTYKTIEMIKENKDFYRLFYAIAFIPEIEKMIGNELKKNEEIIKIFTNYFVAHFDNPEKEITLYSSLIKGATLLYCIDINNDNTKILDYVTEEIIDRFKI